jgi:hypothetical protein
MSPNNNHSNRVPGDLELLRPWLDIIRRARQVGADKGPGIITFKVAIDEFGNPLNIRTTPAVVTLEPRARSAEALAKLLESLSG